MRLFFGMIAFFLFKLLQLDKIFLYICKTKTKNQLKT